MKKTLILAAACSTPALADDMMMSAKCDNAPVMKAEDHARMMKGGTMTMAMKEVDMARTAMKVSKTDDCVKHLDNAMKTM